MSIFETLHIVRTNEPSYICEDCGKHNPFPALRVCDRCWSIRVMEAELDQLSGINRKGER